MHRLQDAPSSYNKHQVHVMTQLQYTNRLTSSLASKYLTVIYDVMTLFTDWLAYVSGNIWMSDYLQTIYKRIDPKEMYYRQFIQGLSKSYVTVVKNKKKCNSQCKTRKLVMKENIGIFNELILFIYLILMLFIISNTINLNIRLM